MNLKIMFLDIDHIAVTSKKSDDDIKNLETLGYKIQFIEKHIPNPLIKKNLMTNFGKYHDLTLIRSDDNLALEFLNHDSINDSSPYIIPVFENVPKNSKQKTDNIDLNYLDTSSNLLKLSFPAVTTSNPNFSEFKFNKLIFKSNDLEKSKNFWYNFGFKDTTINNIQCLEFTSVLKNTKYLIFLEKVNYLQKHFIDDFGPNCIAFISNSIERDREIINKKYFVTDIESLNIHNKELQIFFSKGPSNELVEIISVKNKIQ